MEARDLFESALKDVQAARFSEAAQKLRLLLGGTLPRQDSAGVQGLLGAVLASLNDHQGAVRELGEAATKNPHDPSLFSNLCISLKEVGRLNEAVAAGQRAVELLPNYAAAHCNLGIALKETGDLGAAIESYRKALAIEPDFAEAYVNLAVALQAKGDVEGVMSSWRRVLEIRPDDARAHNNLGWALAEKGELEAAMASYRRAIALRPTYAEAHNNLAVVLLDKGDHESAMESCGRALEIRPDYAEAHSNLGIAYKNLGRFDEAVAAYGVALKIKPDFAEAHDNLCEIYERSNDTAALEKALKQAEQSMGTRNPKILLRHAQLHVRKDRYDDALSCLERIEVSQLNRDFQKVYFGLLGETYDRLRRFDDAYSAFRALNDLAAASPKNRGYDADEFLNAVLAKRDSWVTSAAPNWSAPPSNGVTASPVFLIGFPRSGTTLLDTVLRSHPEITVVEEMPMVDRMRTYLDGPETFDTLDRLTDAEIMALRDAYYQELETQIGGTNDDKIVIDKYPLNISSVGLIYRVFPESKFILVLRHPCDCVLSCFMRDFELNSAMANFLTLEGSARLYTAIMELWSVYRERLHLAVYEIRYEDLVSDLEDACRPLIDFLGLEWNDNLHNYRETARKRRSIRTPSYNQVIKPLYTDARGRWTNYKPHMDAILPLLQPWIEALGYGH